MASSVNTMQAGSTTYGTDSSGGGYIDDINLQAASNPNVSGDISQRISPIVFNQVSGMSKLSMVVVGVVVIVLGFLFIRRRGA